MTEKRAIRTQVLDARRAMPPEEVAGKSRAIVDRLRALEAFRKAGHVLTYVASKDNEVDTLPLIESLLAQGRPVLVPVAEPGGHLTWSRLGALSELCPSRFGILEPQSAFRRPMSPPASGLVLVPGIAFTPNGYRIGYGRGYFDRFLAGFPGVKVGLAYELQIIEGFPAEPHDAPVDLVVTETTVYARADSVPPQDRASS